MRLVTTLLLAAFLLTTLQIARAAEVGFQAVAIPDGDEKPLSGGVWYPTDAQTSPHPIGRATQTVALNAPVAGQDLPLVVISHGSGGWYGGHFDTALALARAGFVVAAVTHRGDSVDDHSRAVQIWLRPAQLKRLTDYMATRWPQRASIGRRTPLAHRESTLEGDANLFLLVRRPDLRGLRILRNSLLRWRRCTELFPSHVA